MNAPWPRRRNGPPSRNGSSSTSPLRSPRTPSGPRSLFLILVLLACSAAAEPRSAAIDLARRRAPGCSECLFFAVPAQSPLVQRHTLFVVSTLDRIPPPFWSVAIPKTGDPLLLDAGNPEDWNRMIVSEKVSLKLDSDVEMYVRAYLDLAVGRALFVPHPVPAEAARIAKPGEKPLAAPLVIRRDEELMTVSFYAREITGELKRWKLVLQPDGTLIEKR